MLAEFFYLNGYKIHRSFLVIYWDVLYQQSFPNSSFFLNFFPSGASSFYPTNVSVYSHLIVEFFGRWFRDVWSLKLAHDFWRFIYHQLSLSNPCCFIIKIRLLLSLSRRTIVSIRCWFLLKSWTFLWKSIASWLPNYRFMV